MKNEKEKRKSAAAVRYEPRKDEAPRVVAKGFGLVAEKILDIARRHGIPIRFDPDLVSLLEKLNLESEIPRELYRAVAEVLALLYRADRERKSRPEGDSV